MKLVKFILVNILFEKPRLKPLALVRTWFV